MFLWYTWWLEKDQSTSTNHTFTGHYVPRNSARSRSALLLALIENRVDLDKARKASEVSKIEFYNWMESDPDFVARYDKYRLMLGTEVEARP